MKAGAGKGLDKKAIKKKLAETHACYVLVTCDGPEEDGKMQVEMSYQGDPSLASYILEGAQNIIEEDALSN